MDDTTNGGNYEKFLRDVLRDFDDRVLSGQKKAEESTKAYQAYVEELKKALKEAQQETSARKEKCSVFEFLSAMTCLTVTCEEDSAYQYSCQVVDGILTGHIFYLEWNKETKEYTYTPEKPLSNSLLQSAKDLSYTLYFPHDMLGRFLANLLYATYHDSNK